ncbi:uncharacterized protein [Haliotis cracherodii]|uniref:uncharacterized protein isoform X2 n=1 Tax=Haliotis cracherodii TaxID=6455 RepID=UPI0039E80A87
MENMQLSDGQDLGTEDNDFPEFLKVRSKPRIVAYVPLETGRVDTIDGQELAENGRHRSTVLPPLDADLSFSRPSRKHITFLQGFSDDGIKCKKISFEIDKKIVSHLRRKMTRRIERRMGETFDDEVSDEEASPDDARRRSGGKKQSAEARKGLFNSYSEVGEKLRKSGSRSRPHMNGHKHGSPQKVLDPLTNDHVAAADPSDLDDRSRRQSDGSRKFSSTTPLPDIGQSDDGARPLTSSSSKMKKVSLQEPERQTDNEEGQASEEDTGRQTGSDAGEEGDISFRRMITSPIQTPVVHRPETRDTARLSSVERRTQILQGYVHRDCPPDDKIMKLYLCSGFADSEVERTVLMEQVWPDLREFCKRHAHELHVLDLHWSLKDATADDHQIPRVCSHYIEDCKDNAMGINFLIFLGEKYGQSLVPSEIPADEFQVILEAATEYKDRQVIAIRAKMAEVEAARVEREKQRQIEAEANSSGVSVKSPDTTLSRDAADRRESGKKMDADEDDVFGDLIFERKASVVRAEGLLMKALREEEEDLQDVDCLTQWYKLDENAKPPVYRLQRISSVYKDITKTDGTRRQAARNNWITSANKLSKVLQTFSQDVVCEEAREKYFTSLLEQELEHILADFDNSPLHTVCYKRTLLGLQNHLTDIKVGEYIDVSPKNNDAIDTKARSRMLNIREEFVGKRVNEGSIHSFELNWIAGGIATTHNRDHLNYLERVCKVTYDMVKRQLTTLFEEEDHSDQALRNLFEEVSQHVMTCHKRVRKFHGRKDILQLIKSYVRSETNTPLVIFGKTGSGKSAILAKAAKDVHKWMKEFDTRVLVRSVGATRRSTNVRTLLRDICLQLCHITGANYKDVPTEYKGLVNDFAYKISQITTEKPLVIFLDAVDRLLDEHDGRKMSWLPKELPSNVHVIISTLPDDKFECFQSLKKSLNGKEDCLLEIGDLPTGDAIAILEYWLNEGNRNLTQHQMDVVLDAFAKAPTPLFLKMAYRESQTWTSYMISEMVKIPETVKKIATIKFGRLERDHGEALVKRALGYITAARNGITSNEMEDVLSLDDAVMDEVAGQFNLSRRRLPPLVWARLKMDLSEYVMECLGDNMKTLCWSHVQFADAADDRYLQQKDKAPSYHKAFAEYFMGIWVGKPKPYSGSDRGVLRFVSDQPLFYEPEESLHDGSDRVYNLRKINELPHHLVRSQQMELLKNETLCNFEWVLAKLCGTSLRAVLEEYSSVLLQEPNDTELKILSDTLHLSGVALQKEPRQLASQMIGRLNGIIARDLPRTAADRKRYPYLHTFVAQAQSSTLPSLIPSVDCLTEPGGILFDLLSGHTDPITALALTSDGMRALTTSEDCTMKLWDIRTGRVAKTLEGMSPNVSTIKTGMNNALAITTEGTVIKIWSLNSGICVHVLDEFVDPANITVASDGRVLVALFDGSNMFRSFDLQSFTQICEKQIPDDGIHKDRSLVVAETCVGDQVLHAFRSSNRATVQNAKTGKIYHNLKCFEKSSSVVSLGFARDYYILACRQQYMELHEIHQLEIFDLKKGNYLRSVRGCVHDNVRDMYINMMGSHAIAICASENNNMSDIALWNLETEDHKHLARHAGVSAFGACLDFRFCLTAAKGDKTLRIWNLTSKINQPAPKLKKSLGVAEIVPMQDNPRYVVARTINNGPISVWNIAKAKCLQTAVRIERGLSETSDVVIVRNSFLVILTDRGFSNVSDDAKPVFQTVLRYNLKTKRYDKKLTGCYIVPAPTHEYMLLDENHLMGPSDSRTHFMVWSLKTGHVLYRIKTNFRELERLKLMDGIPMVDVTKVKRGTTAKMSPWDRRAETDSAKQRRHEAELEEERQRQDDLKKEKENAIEQFIVSGDEKIIVASFFAHHLCVFDIPKQAHTQTLENENSMMFLHVSSLTFDGSHLVHANYDEENKISYVTLWDCASGQVKRRLKRETNVCALGITDDAERVVIGKGPDELHVWDPMKSNSLRKIKGYSGLRFGVGSKIFTCGDGKRAIVFAGDISVWDIEKATVMAVFTPDTRIMCCNVALGGELIAFGLYEKSDVIILKLMSRDHQPQIDEVEGEDMFGEKPDSSDDEDEED